MRNCTAMAGEGGFLPQDFVFLDVCEKYGQMPSIMARESAMWVERMKYKFSVERQAKADRAENEKSRANAGL